MPKKTEREIRRRGGAIRWRTRRFRTKSGKWAYVRVAVVRKKGPRGGKTVGQVYYRKTGRARR